MQTVNPLARFATPGFPTIPDQSRAKYVAGAAAPPQAIDAPPRTSQARIVEAPLIPDAAKSERANAWPAWTQDPVWAVLVGVTAVVWLASTKLMRR